MSIEDDKKTAEEGMDEFELWFLEILRGFLEKSDPEELKSRLDDTKKFSDEISDALSKTINESTEEMLKHLKYTSRKMLREHQLIRRGFERRLYTTWGKAIDLLEMLQVISFEAGRDFNKQHRPSAAKENDLVFEVLTRLHSKACLVSSEILSLLKGGYAEGAYARWRSLHETNVIAWFIADMGQDVAERYLLHDRIESCKAAKQYAKKYSEHEDYFKAGGFASISDDELEKLQQVRDELCSRFGLDYGKNYGWASEALGTRNPNFEQIEAASGYAHMRPFYKLASHGIHAQPKSILYNMASSPNEQLMVAGPSVYGLADPGMSTAISLCQITTNLLMWRRTFEGILAINTMNKLLDETVECFSQVHEMVQNEQAGKRKGIRERFLGLWDRIQIYINRVS